MTTESDTVAASTASPARRLGNQPLAMAAIGAAAISSSAVLTQLAGAPPAATAFFRSVLALPFLAVLAVWEQRRRGPRSARQRLLAVAAGLFLAIDLVLWRNAITDLGAGVATVLGNLQVLFVTAIAWILWRERPGRAFLAALPVVLVGVTLVAGIGGPVQHGTHPVAGLLYGIGTSVAYAGYLLMLRRSSASSAHIAGPVADATAGSTIGALLIGLVIGGLTIHPLWPAIGWLAIMAVGSQTIGWLFITSSLPRLPAAISSLMLLLQPAGAMVLAAIVLGEQPTALQLVGALLTCGGALAASLASTRPAAKSATA